MSYEIKIPRKCVVPFSPERCIELSAGSSVIFIGANGAGKTRLGVFLENNLPEHKVHRIAAQKVLQLNDKLDGLSFERANNALRFGTPDGTRDHKGGHRWAGKPATSLLNDFNALQQALFAQHQNVATQHLEAHALDPNTPVPVTKLQKLIGIWNKLLPHRKLAYTDSKIIVSTNDGT